MKLKRIDLKNIVNYASETIDLDKNQISVYYGPNGSGKSILFRSIKKVLYGSDSPSSKKAPLGNSSKIGLSFDDLEIEWLSNSKNTTFSKSIKVKGVSKNFSKRDLDAFMKSRVYTELEYDSFVYLSGFHTHPFLVGTSNQRYKYLSDLYQLDNIDGYYKFFASKLNDLQKVDFESEALKSSLGQKPSFDRTGYERAKKTYQRALLSKANAERIMEQNARIKIFNRDRKKAASIIEKYAIDISKISSLVEEAQKYRYSIEEYRRYKKNKARYLKQEFSLREAKRKLISLENVRRLTEEHNRKEDQKLRAYEQALTDYQHQEKKRKKILSEIELTEDPSIKYGFAVHATTLLHKKHACPICKGKISNDVVANIKKMRNTLEPQVTKLHSLKKLLPVAIQKPEKPVINKKVSVDTTELRQKVESYIDRPGRVVKPQKTAPLEHLIFVQSTLSRCGSLTIEKEQHVPSINKKIFDDYAERRSSKQDYEQYKKRKGEVDARIRQNKRTLRRKHVLTWLKNCYSPKGIKSILSANIAAHFNKILNANTHLLFEEVIHFDVTVTDNKLDVLVHKGARQYSASELSGSESRRFALLMLLANLSIVPNKPNVVILDEMDAGMHEENRALFSYKFLPALQKLIPHVVVITPSKYNIPEAVYYQIKQKGSKSYVCSPSA